MSHTRTVVQYGGPGLQCSCARLLTGPQFEGEIRHASGPPPSTARPLQCLAYPSPAFPTTGAPIDLSLDFPRPPIAFLYCETLFLPSVTMCRTSTNSLYDLACCGSKSSRVTFRTSGGSSRRSDLQALPHVAAAVGGDDEGQIEGEGTRGDAGSDLSNDEASLRFPLCEGTHIMSYHIIRSLRVAQWKATTPGSKAGAPADTRKAVPLARCR